MRNGVEKYRAAVVNTVNEAFEAGRLQGISEERTRVKALIDGDLAASTPTPRRPTVGRARKYGKFISIVRPALRDIGEEIDAAGMSILIGAGITTNQCRNALRQLVRNGEAVATTRGKFLWRQASESPAAEKPGESTPGSFGLAAE